jgi:hypothetical protein
MKKVVVSIIFFYIYVLTIYSQTTTLSISGQIFKKNPLADHPDYVVSAKIYLVKIDNSNNVVETIGPSITNREGVYGVYDFANIDRITDYYLVIVNNKNKVWEKVWEQKINANDIKIVQGQYVIKEIILE